MERAHTNLAVTVIGVAVIIVLGGFMWFGMGPPPTAAVPESAAAPTTVGIPASITVHISGAVLRPGLVSIADGSRMADAVAAAGGALPSADLGSINLARQVRDSDHVIVPVHGEGSGSPGESADGIDINTATASELEALPGVGPVLAERIVAFRTERGPFSSVEDLLDVPGIGEAKLAQMRDTIAEP
ncbi:MAG TPA: ComEA family DNA-binding protein [Acidimicrobiia bacterium]|nr:ComEA family DNA-binding protein [Acidimicrobiia bacterium]